MEKQSYLPTKFYHRNGVQDYEKTKNYSGDVAIPKYPFIGFPAFQLVLPDKSGTPAWALSDFAIDIVAYNTGNSWPVLTFDIKPPVVYDAGDFWVLVLDFFPWDSMPTNINLEDGLFYYRVEYYSGANVEGEWFSEVFQMCDLGLNALTAGFTNIDIDNIDTSYAGGLGAEYVWMQWCEQLADNTQAYMPIECFPGEELDVFVRTMNFSGVCAETDWAQEATLSIVGSTSGSTYSRPSNISMTAADEYTYTRWKVIVGADETATELRVLLELDANNTKGGFEIWVQRTWKADHIQLSYSNTRNFCKIVYEDDYVNRFFLDAKQVIDNNQLEETTVEDDQANKYRIIGTNQVYNSVQFAGGEYLLNAMSLLRLHDDITIVGETGEPMDVVEVLMEQNVLEYEAVLIKLVYREDSCSWTHCEFTTA